MNILLVSDAYLPTVSGVASSTDSIARYMAKEGHVVDLVCPKPLTAYEAPPQQGLTIWYTPSASDSLFVNKAYTPFPLGFSALWHCFRSKRYDVVHIQEPGSLGITALILAKLFRVPTVGARHFSWLQIERIVPAWLRFASVPLMKIYVFIIYHAYTAIMVPTKTAGKELEELIGLKKRIHAISNGVETNEYVPVTGNTASLRKRNKIPDKGTVFLYIGRLDKDKNVETIFRAAAQCSVPVHLVIVGVGTEKERLIALGKELDLSSRITWFEETTKSKIIELYQSADVFVIMSPVETQSIVALQAISCGLPLIAANAGALPELVNDKNGFLIKTYDIEALTAVMDTLATDKTLQKSMGKESRKLAMNHHKPLVLHELESLFQAVARPR